MSSVGYERRKAVAEAWKNEKSLVKDGRGTRDWSQKEQKEILSKGKATGYQGHHMKSVDGHNSKAGDANNIQFLSRIEHLTAHNGSFRNNTNGRYDPATGKTFDFGRNKAQIDSQKLSKPLSESQKKAVALNKTNADAKSKAADLKPRSVSKSKSSTNAPTYAKGSTQSKTLAGQRAAKPSAAPKTATASKTLSAQRSSASSKGTASGKGVSVGHSASSGKSASAGQGSSSGKRGGQGH